MKILLVDDDIFLRDMYATKFVDSGHDVDNADGSNGVISLLERGNKYDLVLLDMVMPGTNGVELLKIINEKFPDKVKHSIFLTNQGQDEDIKEAKRSGAIGYIIKADTIPSEVVTEVEKILKDKI